MKIHADEVRTSGSHQGQPMTRNSMSAKDIALVESIKSKVKQSSSHYRQCGLRDAVTSDQPLEKDDWYIVLIAAQASKTVYGDAPNCSGLADTKEGDIFYEIAPVDGKPIPPVVSLNNEIMSSIEDLCELFHVNPPSKNLFLDSSTSDLQAWFCEMPNPLTNILSRSVADKSLTAASGMIDRILRASSDLDIESGPQILIAFRGTSSAADAVVDLKGYKVPLTWAGKFGKQMSEDYAKLTPRIMDDIIRHSHQAGRTKLSAACRALMEQEGGLGALLRDAAVHAGFMSMYQSGRQQLLQLLDSPAYRDASGAFKASLLVCGHSMGGALARLCAFDLIACGRVPASRVSLVTFGAGPVGNRALCKLLDLLHPRRDLHVVNNCDPVPAAALAFSDGGSVSGCLSALLARGSFSHSGSRIWFQEDEGALLEPAPPARCSACARRLDRLLGYCACCFPGAEPSIPQHYLAPYIRKVAALALRAGVPVLCTFPGSPSNPPAPGWARSLLAGEREARRASLSPAVPRPAP